MEAQAKISLEGTQLLSLEVEKTRDKRRGGGIRKPKEEDGKSK